MQKIQQANFKTEADGHVDPKWQRQYLNPGSWLQNSCYEPPPHTTFYAQCPAQGPAHSRSTINIC